MIKQLHRIVQGNKSVEEYYQELEATLHRVQIDENPEATMARFLGGLRKDITHRVELTDYADLEDLFHKACQIEGQIKEMSSGYRTYSTPQRTNN